MKEPSNAPNYIDSFIKYSDEPHNTNQQYFQSMSSKCPSPACTWSQTVAPLVNRSLDNILFRVQPSLHVTNLCFEYA